jgi:hypothetical protein
LLVLYSIKQFENLPCAPAVWYPATALQQGSHARRQFGNLPLQQDNSRRVHAVWYPVTANDCRSLVCSLRNCRCGSGMHTQAMHFENLPLQPGSSDVAETEELSGR